MKFRIVLLFTLISSVLFAQGEANYWYFGMGAGVNFNTSPPSALQGSLFTNEGCSSFSDKNGDLLFYSDGSTVWNKNHNPMPNGTGLLGNSSSTQSAIIVPHPGNSSQYYIFTVGANFQGAVAGFYAYIVDMNANGGLGDVVGGPINLGGSKNSFWTEKVTSVQGAECNTFWVISLVQNTFYCYKIDENGLASTPVINQVDYFASDVRGYLKVSPDGKKLACATFTQYRDENNNNIVGNGKLHLYEFDDATGRISESGISLLASAAIDGAPYGVEFSANSTKLYTSTYNGNDYKLFQFDLNETNVIASKALIHQQIGYRGGLQLAPNGKIYVTIPVSYQEGTAFLDVINLPDEKGLLCNFEIDAINLGNRRAMQGLPPFIASILLPLEITSETNNNIITNKNVNICTGSNYTFIPEPIAGTPTYSWVKNGVEISTSKNLELINTRLSDTGKYTLTVSLSNSCGKSKFYSGSFTLEVNDPPADFILQAYNQCDFDENPNDGVTLFNLTTKNSELTNNNADLIVSYYESTTDLVNNSPIQNPEKYTSTSKTILVKVKNTKTQCATSGDLELVVHPTSLDTYSNAYACENYITNQNQSLGIKSGTFDFEQIRSNISTLYTSANITIEFYENVEDAQLQNNALENLVDLETTTIYVRISDKTSQYCVSVGTFEAIVNPIPTPNGSEEATILCIENPPSNSPSNYVTLHASNNTTTANTTYQWYLNEELLPNENASFLNAYEAGIYKVEATLMYENDSSTTDDNSYCTGYNTFEVIASNPAFITQSDLIIVDDSTDNSITINTENLGLGSYEFSLNNEFTNYQDEAFFENVPAGIHTLYIQDKKGCGITSIEVSVLGFPKFFSPNNDGINDYWVVTGATENFYKSLELIIYNRYGKVIAVKDITSTGWDGTYNGELLPATDYWFTVKLVDFDNNIRLRKGHFSLIR